MGPQRQRHGHLPRMSLTSREYPTMLAWSPRHDASSNITRPGALRISCPHDAGRYTNILRITPFRPAAAQLSSAPLRSLLNPPTTQPASFSSLSLPDPSDRNGTALDRTLRPGRCICSRMSFFPWVQGLAACLIRSILQRAVPSLPPSLY